MRFFHHVTSPLLIFGTLQSVYHKHHAHSVSVHVHALDQCDGQSAQPRHIGWAGALRRYYLRVHTEPEASADAERLAHTGLDDRRLEG
jgi:hypothetical protein